MGNLVQHSLSTPWLIKLAAPLNASAFVADPIRPLEQTGPPAFGHKPLGTPVYITPHYNISFYHVV